MISTIYSPLVPEDDQIRLLTLQAGQFDEDIICSLHTVSLKKRPQYEALSYLWGNTNITLPVIVDGQVIQVTTNLEAALRHLRWCEKPRILWVDAICINQQDIGEKNVQVPMMGDIYRDAMDTLAWFGHGDEQVTKAITWTQYHMLHHTSEATLEWSELETIASTDEHGQKIKFSSLMSAIRGCLNLAQHDYWSRMWTFQEFVLPRQSPTCVYGHFTFSISNILEAARSLYDYSLDCQMAADIAGTRKTDNVVDLVYPEYSQWLVNTATRVQQRLMTTQGQLERTIAKLGPGALDYLLMMTAARKSSDPRDRIYALYGLSPALPEKLRADYSKTAKQVVLEAISHMVGNNCCWLWLSFSPRSDRFSSKTFPSWCPDLDSPSESWSLTNRCEALDYDPSSMIVDRISNDLTTCHLWSWNLGFCKVLGRIHVETNAELVKSGHSSRIGFQAAKRLWLCLAGLEDYDHTTAQVLRRRFVRYVVSSFEEHTQVSDEDLFEALEAVSNDMTEFEIENEDYVSQVIRLVSKIQLGPNKVACVVTSRGCVAFSPIDTEDNDLMILPQSPTPPMVLRKEHSDSSHSDQDFYLMVGPARVDLINSGEDHEVAAVSKIRKLGVAEYLIH